MIELKDRKLRMFECWYSPECPPVASDLVSIRQVATKLKKGYHKTFNTLLVDLGQSEATLEQNVQKSSFAKIRRARDRDGLTVVSIDHPSAVNLDDFIAFYDRFAESKGLGGMSRSLLSSYLDAGLLVFRKVVLAETSRDLVWHSYIVEKGRARLFHSASDYRNSEDSGFRNLVGRANRFLHWDDMLHFKTAGIKTYDLGGWYAGDTDQDKMAINVFKKEFGGIVSREYDVLQPGSMSGWLYILRDIYKGFRAKHRAQE